MTDAPKMQIRPGQEARWKQYHDEGSNDWQLVLPAAEKWAVYMEQRLAAGEELTHAFVHRTYDEATYTPYGTFDGFFVPWLVQALTECWVHGEKLKEVWSR